jgi:hypothetical protein
MSQPSLVVRFADLEAILTALQTSQDGLSERVQVMRADVEAFLAGWAADTESRQAQLDFDRRLGRWGEELTAALEAIRAALAATAEAARTAEVRNVAIMD